MVLFYEMLIGHAQNGFCNELGNDYFEVRHYCRVRTLNYCVPDAILASVRQVENHLLCA